MFLALFLMLAPLLGQRDAQAFPILLDFEGFSDADLLTTQYDYLGVTFENALVLTAGVSLNELDFPPHSGANVVFDNGGAVLLSFLDPIVDFAGYFTYTSPLSMTAFDADGNVVATILSTYSSNYASSGNAPNEYLSLSLGTPASRIQLLGALAGGSFTADDLTFSTAPNVPEPSSLSLAIVGMLGLSGLLRRSPRPRCDDGLDAN